MSGIHNEVTSRPASTEEDGVWAWVFRECEDCDGEWMVLCVVMNRCATVEGGADGGKEKIGERWFNIDDVDEEELEMGSLGVCCSDHPVRACHYLHDYSNATKGLLLCV